MARVGDGSLLRQVARVWSLSDASWEGEKYKRKGINSVKHVARQESDGSQNGYCFALGSSDRDGLSDAVAKDLDDGIVSRMCSLLNL